MKKIILIITISILTILIYIIPSVASSEEVESTQSIPEVKEEMKLADNNETIEGMLQAGKNFIIEGENSQEDGKGNVTTIDKGKLEDMATFIYKIIFSIASLLVAVVGIIIGIQFMIASSSEEKAKWKETLKVYIVGVIVIYGALGIWFFALNILNKYTPDATKTQQEKRYEEILRETDKSSLERDKSEQKTEKENEKEQSDKKITEKYMEQH